jgi:uncharacterized protein (TIGR02246 family)
MTRPHSAVAALLAVLLATSACAPSTPPSQDSGESRATIEKLITDYVGGLNANDLDAVVAPMAADVIFMPNGAPTRQGLEAVRAHFQEILTQATYSMVATVEDIEISGDFAWATTAYSGTTVTSEGEENQIVSKGLFVLRREPSGGAWRIAIYMFNVGS